MDDITKSTLRFVREEKLQPHELKNDAKFHARLYPYLLERAEDEWEGVFETIEWADSAAYKHFKDHTKNLLKRDGQWLYEELNPQKKAAKDNAEKVVPEDQSETATPQKTIMMITRKQGKRDAPEADAIYQDTEPEPKAKRLRVEKQEVKSLSSLVKTTAQKIAEIQGKKELTHDEKVSEIKLVAENIRLKKMELNNLYKAWRVLRADIYPEIDDPMADLK